jgi:hypothetical protein
MRNGKELCRVGMTFLPNAIATTTTFFARKKIFFPLVVNLVEA